MYGDYRRTSVVKPFDPWKSSLCTCRPKYSLHPYTGCSHFCLYCYATAYIGRKPSMPKQRFLDRLKRDLKFINKELFIEMSSSSDPYPPIESWMGLTRKTLEILSSEKYRVIIVTKSDIIVRDADLLLKTPSVVMITITTLDEDLAKKLEPGAPPPWKRLNAIEKLSEYGIPVGIRIDPVIPGLNDDPNSISEIIREASLRGAKHVVTSTYKARPDNLKRMISAFPDKADYWRKLYLELGEKIHGYYYLPRQLRIKILKPVIDAALRYGLTASVCREGLGLEFMRAPSCDGQHMIKYHPLYSSLT
ncbi:MAG: spore photoproduct lyase family protein [Thermoprotei archaeon]